MRIDFPMPDHDQINKFSHRREGKDLLMDVIMIA